MHEAAWGVGQETIDMHTVLEELGVGTIACIAGGLHIDVGEWFGRQVEWQVLDAGKQLIGWYPASGSALDRVSAWEVWKPRDQLVTTGC
jgi:hypothetical protein